jgi:hypothetical protein
MARGRQLKDTLATQGIVETVSESPLDLSAGHPLEQLNVLVREFCFALGLDAASIVYGINNRWRVIATHNTPRAFCSYPNSPNTLPFKIAERLIVPDLAANLSLRNRLAGISLKFGLCNWRALVRVPFPIGPQEWFAVTGHARAPKVQFPPDGLRQLQTLEAKIGNICHALLPELRKFGDKPGFPLTLSQLAAYVESSGQAISLKDENIKMITGSPAISAVLGMNASELKGHGIGKLAGGFAVPIALLFKNAIETGFTSPDIEINLSDLGSSFSNFDQHASPVYVKGRKLPVLVVHYSHVGGLSHAPLPLPNNRPVMENGSATVEFLMETLAKHRTIRSRGGAAYITLRSWVGSIKPHQIRALKAIKRHCVENLAERIAAEMEVEIDRIAGFDGFTAIVPVPGGH